MKILKWKYYDISELNSKLKREQIEFMVLEDINTEKEYAWIDLYMASQQLDYFGVEIRYAVKVMSNIDLNLIIDLEGKKFSTHEEAMKAVENIFQDLKEFKIVPQELCVFA